MASQAKNKPPLSEFKNFIFEIVKKRVFLFSMILGVSALVIQLTLSEFSLPQFYTFGFVFLGLAWSAYQAYKDLSLKYQKALSQIPAEKVKNSNFLISYVHGNEYSYSLPEPFSGRNELITKMQNTKGVKSHFDERGIFFISDKVYYLMGKGELEINIQLQNSGDLPLNVLSVEVDHNLRLNHLLLSHDGIFLHGKQLPLPCHLESGELVTFQARYAATINRGSNDALFAADFRALPKFITHRISVSTVDTSNSRQTYDSELKTPSKPLIDLYVKQWKEYDQEEYLVLAGCDLTEKL